MQHDNLQAKPLSADGRFTIAPYYRPTRRSSLANQTGRTRDGWLVRDTWSGAVWHHDTQREARCQLDLRLAEQACIDWSAVRAWKALLGRRTSASNVEVYLVDADGRQVAYLGLAARSVADDDAGTRENIASLLEHLGHGELHQAT